MQGGDCGERDAGRGMRLMSASVCSLQDINPPNSAQCSETLKPVKPPFLPPPSFALDGPEHSRRYSSNWRTYKSMTDDRTIVSTAHSLSCVVPDAAVL